MPWILQFLKRKKKKKRRKRKGGEVRRGEKKTEEKRKEVSSSPSSSYFLALSFMATLSEHVVSLSPPIYSSLPFLGSHSTTSMKQSLRRPPVTSILNRMAMLGLFFLELSHYHWNWNALLLKYTLPLATPHHFPFLVLQLPLFRSLGGSSSCI